MICDFRVDSWCRRAVSLINQSIHLMLTKNYFFVVDMVGVVLFYIFKWPNWHVLSLKIRKNKSLTPFQHQSALFLRKPSIYQLLSIRHGISKDYSGYAAAEIEKRDLFLKSIPERHHKVKAYISR